MKKALVGIFAIALVFACASAMAYEPKVWDDLSWWGQSGAKPAPVKDTLDRSGYWWWPTEPASNADDAELWGNRGVVYANYEEKKVEPPKAKPPVEAPKPVPSRTKPVLNNVLFDFDKAVLKAEGKAETDKVITWMKDNAKDVLTIEGHTCTIGSEQYNMGLGQRRSDSVKKYMVDNGVAADRIKTQSYGETKPAVPNDTPANRKLNRRAVFDIQLVD